MRVELPNPGTEIRGKYRVARLIGEGGMGVVYEALHVRLKQNVAIKVLQPARNSERDAARFMREARAASQLQSHHVARVLDVDELPNGLPFMVMEYLDGCDLEHELQNRGRLAVSEAVDYVLQTCQAVAEAHQKGIIHRDLKPSNLFLCDHGDERIVKVLDFGISKMADEVSVTLTSTSLGTPLYMSPEQIRNSKEVDQRSDIWSLGVILFELLAGQPPFEGKGGATAVSVSIVVDPPPWLRTLRTDVPQDLERVVMRMLEKDLGKRFQSVAEVVEALRPFATDPQFPGHVRVSELPCGLTARPTPDTRPTASTVSGSRLHSAWTTDSRGNQRSRFVYYAIGAAAFVLGGGFSAAVLGPALLAQAQSGGGPLEAPPALGPIDSAQPVHEGSPSSEVEVTPVPASALTALMAPPSLNAPPSSSPGPSLRTTSGVVPRPRSRFPVPAAPSAGPVETTPSASAAVPPPTAAPTASETASGGRPITL